MYVLLIQEMNLSYCLQNFQCTIQEAQSSFNVIASNISATVPLQVLTSCKQQMKFERRRHLTRVSCTNPYIDTFLTRKNTKLILFYMFYYYKQFVNINIAIYTVEVNYPEAPIHIGSLLT